MKSISMKKRLRKSQSGAVSLFVVVFAMLIISVVTVSFLRLMVADQQQASDNDLSQSAYDSALAGVEDAKRAVVQYQQDCSDSPTLCSSFAETLSGPNRDGAACNVGLQGVVATASTGAEVPIQQTVVDTAGALDQAYTCVKIKLNTEDYVGNLSADQSQLVPLFSDKMFNLVKLEWFSKEDLATGDVGSPVNLPSISSGTSLPQKGQNPGQWPVNRPSLMRTQLIQFANSGYTLSNFDTVRGAESNGATMFLYPTRQPAIGTLPFTTYDQRKTDPLDDPNPKDTHTPTAVSCKTSISSGGYACSAVLALPQAIGGSASVDGKPTFTAFLRLVPLYNGAHFRVTLWNGSVDASVPASLPKFKDVQPEVDSTGRANELFRRIVSRIDLYDTSFPYPEATIDVTGDFCKDFAVTDTQYIPGSASCRP